MSELKHINVGESWLAHHGIKGQQWGVQNGPPYPIPSGDHSAAEKKHKDRYDKRKKQIDDSIRVYNHRWKSGIKNKSLERKAKKIQKKYNDFSNRNLKTMDSLYDGSSLLQIQSRSELAKISKKEYDEKLDKISRKFAGKYADTRVEYLSKYESITYSQAISQLITKYNDDAYTKKYITDDARKTYARLYQDASNEAHSYLMKSGRMKGRQDEEYKLVQQELYEYDPKFRKLLDLEEDYREKMRFR